MMVSHSVAVENKFNPPSDRVVNCINLPDGAPCKPVVLVLQLFPSKPNSNAAFSA